MLPDVDYNPPVEMDMPEIEVSIAGGDTGFADRDGNYVLMNGRIGPVTVETIVNGRWVRVMNQAGDELFLSQEVLPPGPADFLFNTAPEEFTTSQVNGLVLTTGSHNFFTDRQPDFDGLDIQLAALVNNTGACDAFFNGNAIIFLRAGTAGPYECVNTCYSTVVAHEYGHFVLSRHGLGGGAFVEGYADAYALLIFNDPLMGADFAGPGTSARDYNCNRYQYPCTGAEPACGTEFIVQNPSHGCAKVLGGIWWRIKGNLQETMGEEPGLELTRQLFTDWTGITMGGIGLNSAYPQTAIEVLTVDDDDGDLDNGTPHDGEICEAFAAFGIDCPGVFGDLNGDGIVGVADLLILLASWGPCPPEPDPCPADLDGDGTVGVADLLLLIANWG